MTQTTQELAPNQAKTTNLNGYTFMRDQDVFGNIIHYKMVNIE